MYQAHGALQQSRSIQRTPVVPASLIIHWLLECLSLLTSRSAMAIEPCSFQSLLTFHCYASSAASLSSVADAYASVSILIRSYGCFRRGLFCAFELSVCSFEIPPRSGLIGGLVLCYRRRPWRHLLCSIQPAKIYVIMDVSERVDWHFSHMLVVLWRFGFDMGHCNDYFNHI